MVEIIRPGNKPENRTYEATCQHCHCRIRFTRKEARYESDQRDGDALVIRCPTCERDVWVSP